MGSLVPPERQGAPSGDDRVPLPRREVRETTPEPHGALDYAELERMVLDQNCILDFSVNSNPYGPPPGVHEALDCVPLDRYPDRESLALRRALADSLGRTLGEIVVGNGTAELLGLIALAFLRAGDRVLVVGPSFGEYARVSRLMGAQVDVWMAQREQGFAVDPADVQRRLRELEPRLVFLCNPNNPTGTALEPAAMADWAAAHPETLFIVDEAYLAFARGLLSALSLQAPNVLVLRSMTKDYALAGLRLGYAVGPPRVVDALARVRSPWNVNALAQAAGLAALRDQGHLRETLDALQAAGAQLVTGLRQRGWDPLPSTVHFFLIDVGDGGRLWARLLREGVLVRDCASFGLPSYVRIAARRPEENARLLAAMVEVGSPCG